MRSSGAGALPPRSGRRKKLIVTAVLAVAVLASVASKVLLGQSVLLWAIEGRHFTVSRLVLGLGVDANGDPQRESPLSVAAVCRPEFVRLLLAHGADPRRENPSRGFPLNSVPADACDAIPELVEMLVAAGADPKACFEGATPLLATPGLAKARALLDHGADPNQSCPEDPGSNALNHVAAYPDVMALLLDHGAKILAAEPYGWTPLHEAANLGRKDYQSQHPGRLKSAELLLEHGADVNAVDKQGRTALDLAYEHGDKEMSAILTKHGGKSRKHESLEAGEAARDSADEYRELFSVAEGVRRGPGCSLDMHGDNRAIMEEGPNWSIVQGTVGVVKVNCHAAGYFHYAVLGMGSPVPKRLNMPLPSGMGGSEKITFDAPWSNGAMHWYYSRERITNLVRALSRGDASHFAVRYVNVGK